MTNSRRVSTRAALVAENQGRYFCHCGCGEPIKLLVAHFSTGIPRYRLGHNPQLLKPIPPRRECECGCGQMTGPGKRFVSGHNGRGVPRSAEMRDAVRRAMTGERNHRFGKRPANYLGRYTDDRGYVYVHVAHPFADSKGVVREHRLVMEAHLRATDPSSPHLVEVEGVLYLRPEVDVHHVDGVKRNNDIENLEALSKSDHARRHMSLGTRGRPGPRR